MGALRRRFRAGAVVPLLLLAAVLSGPENLARIISGITSAITWPITQEFAIESNRFEIFNAELLLIYIIAALGLNLVMQTGLISLGHSAFFALGAYTTAVATASWNWSFYVSIVFAAVLAGVIGLLLGIPALRLGLYALVMVTVGYAFVAEDLALELRGLTGGGEGLSGVEYPSPFDEMETYYWLVVIVVVVVFVLHRNLLRSPFGRASQAVEEGEVAARSLGLSPTSSKLRPFTISAAVAGFAGGLYVPLIGFIAPDSVTVDLAILFVLMVLLGGTGTVLGPVIGAILLFRLPIEVERVADQPGDWSRLIYGLLLLLSVFAFPRGLMSAWERLQGRFTRTPRAVVEDARNRADVAACVTPSGEEGNVLELNSVSKTLSGVRALIHVDLVVEAGTVHALIGPNGAGKTTMLNVISGYLRPDEGEVKLRGRLSKSSVHRRSKEGLARTFQTPLVFEKMSCLDNVMVAMDSHRKMPIWLYALRYPGARREERAHVERSTAILASVGLGQRMSDRASALPPGERRLLEIARVVALNPSVVLMDEPAAGLTGDEIEELEEVVRALSAAGIGVLLVEHHVGLVLRLADVVTVIDYGRVISHGTPDHISNDPKVIAAYLGGERMAEQDSDTKGVVL
jgi:branched-chain amino acid transport system permease protein